MIFTIQAQEMFLEIDLTSLVSTISGIETQINSSRRKTEFWVKKLIEWLNKTLTSSVIKIKKRKFQSSLNYTNITNARLVEWKNWIYLVFSVIEWNKKYTYDFKLMNKISYKFKRKFLFFGSYEIVIDEESLKVEVMTRILNNWVRKYYTVKNIWLFNINLKLVWIFTLIVWLFGLWIANAFAYLGA